MKWMIHCKEATNYISLKEEGKLTFKKHLQLKLHLAICALCKRFYRQNKLILTNTARLEEQLHARLSREEKDSMVHALRDSA